MSDTTYVDFQTPAVNAAWLNDVNITVYRALGVGGVAPATAAAIISNLGVPTLAGANVFSGALQFTGVSIPFTNIPTFPTATPGDNSTKGATTGFVVASFAPLASPTFTGTPLAPTAAGGTNTTQLATTAFVTASNQVLANSVASAATINLETAVDSCHITGAVTITAVTLGAGHFRTVIFDGSLTLTHNSLTNNLPGAANILTQTGDRAVYWSDGTTVYCISYVSAGIKSMVRLNTQNGNGSTNTCIRRFTNTQTSQGADITYADSATNGATFTINTAGVYSISYSDAFSAANYAGISLNSANLTTSIASCPVAEVLALADSLAANQPICCSWTGYLASGSIIRAHTNVTPGNGTANAQFTISRVG